MTYPALLGALLIGLVMGLLGAGGAILTVPILHYLLGHSEKAAVAESLAIVGAIAAFGALRGIRAGNTELRIVLSFGLAGIAGAVIGSAAARHVPGPVQLALLALVMLAAATLMVRQPPRGDAPPRPHPFPLLAAQGLGVGVLTGLLGVGGGFLIVPALVLLGGLPMKRAVPTSLAIIFLNTAGGFLTHLANSLRGRGPDLNWAVILLFSAVGIAGSFLGAHLGARLNQRLLRTLFAAFLLLLAAYILWRELPALLHL